MDRINLVNQVAILSILMLLGFFITKIKLLNKDINKALTNLLINLTLPCMIIVSFNFQFSKDMLYKSGKIITYSLIIHILLIFLSKIVYLKYTKDKEVILRFLTIFSNSGFIGYPVINGIYGKIGVFYVSMFTIPFNLLMWTYGIMLYSGKTDARTIKKAFLNPGIICTVIGFFIFIFSIKIPIPILKTLDMVGNMTTPIAMMVVGSMLSQCDLKEIFGDITVYYTSLVRLIIVPIFTFIILKQLGASGIILNTCILLEAMPAPALAAVFSEQFGYDASFASKCIFMTTVLSVITIPFVVIYLC